MSAATTLALDELLAALSTAPAAVRAAAAELVPLHLRDQYAAASAEVDRAFADAAATQAATEVLGYIHWSDIPDWLRLGLADAIRGYTDATARTCLHTPDPRHPAPVVAAAWRPGLVCCPPCAAMRLHLRGEADRRCDRCGRVVAGVEHDDGIHPVRIAYGPLIYLAGACGDCWGGEAS